MDQSVMNDGATSQIRNGLVTDRPLFGFNMYTTNAIVNGGAVMLQTMYSELHLVQQNIFSYMDICQL